MKLTSEYDKNQDMCQNVQMTWEEAVSWLRKQPDQSKLVYACYFDDPVIEAAKRFANSEEWRETQKFLPESKGSALDIGAGRGISSYALASMGWDVTALEPDRSNIVGTGAIRELSKGTGLAIGISEEYGESLPFDDNSFDLVYGRQVLHHAKDLKVFMKEVCRVLKPGGRFIATREHVISRPEDLKVFLDNHPLHKYCGGECAYQVKYYTSALQESGLKIIKTLGPLENVINYYPLTREECKTILTKPLSRIIGTSLTHILTDEKHLMGRCVYRSITILSSYINNSPGRLYSFIAEK